MSNRIPFDSTSVDSSISLSDTVLHPATDDVAQLVQLEDDHDTHNISHLNVNEKNVNATYETVNKNVKATYEKVDENVNVQIAADNNVVATNKNASESLEKTLTDNVDTNIDTKNNVNTNKNVVKDAPKDCGELIPGSGMHWAVTMTGAVLLTVDTIKRRNDVSRISIQHDVCVKDGKIGKRVEIDLACIKNSLEIATLCE